MCVILNDIDTGKIACISHMVFYALKYNYITKQFSTNNITMSVQEIITFHILLNRLTDHNRELDNILNEWMKTNPMNYNYLLNI